LFSAIENRRSFDKKHTALPMLKTHLYDLILDSLRAYHQGSTAQSQAISLLESCRLLSNKGLYDQSLVVLDKAERLCKEHGLSIDLLTVQHFRVNIFNASSLSAAIRDDINLQEQVSEESMAKAKALLDSHILVTRIFQKIRGGDTSSSEGEKAELETLLQKAKKMAEDPHTDSTLIIAPVYSSIGGYYILSGDKNKGLDAYLTLLGHFNTHPSQKKEYVKLYANTLYNIVSTAITLSRLDLAKQNLEELYLLRSVKTNFGTYISGLCFMLKLSLLSKEHPREPLDQVFLEEVLNFIRVADDRINPREKFYLFSALAQTFFSKGKYSRALTWVNRILNECPENTAAGIVYNAKIIQLLVHYELNKDELLPYLIRNAYRYFRRRKNLGIFESTILRHVQRMKNADNKRKLKESFNDLRKDLSKMQQDSPESFKMDYFDFSIWLEGPSLRLHD